MRCGTHECLNVHSALAVRSHESLSTSCDCLSSLVWSGPGRREQTLGAPTHNGRQKSYCIVYMSVREARIDGRTLEHYAGAATGCCCATPAVGGGSSQRRSASESHGSIEGTSRSYWCGAPRHSFVSTCCSWPVCEQRNVRHEIERSQLYATIGSRLVVK